MNQAKGTLFILSGPSGVGKGTLKERLLEEFKDHTAFSVSATTRAPRPTEIDGQDYFFIKRPEFEEKIRRNGFLEHAEYAGNLYGTPRAWVERILQSGRDVILEIEVNGARQVMENTEDPVSVFILPPSVEELERRLRARGTEAEDKIQKRLETAQRELRYSDCYQYRIVNDDLDTAYQELRDIYLRHAGFMKTATTND